MFCQKCGANVGSGAAFCPNCGAPVQANANAQSQPQPQVQPVYVEQKSDKSKVVAALLAWFLGCLGIHNFYLGFTGKGIAQLLMTVLSLGFLSPITAIWAFVEMIIILLGNSRDGQGRKLSD